MGMMGIRTNTHTYQGTISGRYGAELHDDANAASDPNGNEADATTGWTNSGCSTFESAEVAGDTGTYSISAVSDSEDDGFYKDIGTDWSLVVGKTYLISFDARHSGSDGVWGMGLGGNNGQTSTLNFDTLTSSDTTFASYSEIFIYSTSHRYFVCREASATNDGGIYFDNLSCKEIFP